MNCKYLTKKLNGGFKCKLNKKNINLNECSNCTLKLTETPLKLTKHSKRYNYIKQLEKCRFSLFTKELDKCYFCNKQKDNLHELIYGKNRQNSMKYGLVLPLCIEHHQLMHQDKNLINKYHLKSQELFEKEYPDLSFINIFKINYK